MKCQYFFRSLPEGKLHMRTFKVVPLSQRSGILEWCVGTIPIGDYLVGANKTSGAHKTYNPKDITALKCMEYLKTSREKIMTKKSRLTEAQMNSQKVKIFMDICKQFRPVFRHFFYEKFPNMEQHLGIR